MTLELLGLEDPEVSAQVRTITCVTFPYALSLCGRGITEVTKAESGGAGCFAPRLVDRPSGRVENAGCVCHCPGNHGS